MAVRGISLLDLAPLPAGAQALIPEALAAHLENLAVVNHSSTSSATAHIHSGVVQPISDLGFPALRDWPVEVPGLNTGLPFRLVRMRTEQSAGQNLEPAAAGLFLDLVVERIAITVPGLRPATLIPSAPGIVAHLAPDPSRSGVRIVGAGTVRIDLSGAGETVRFIDSGDPFDPMTPTGAVYALNFEPTSFYFGDSELGMTVDRLVWDDSEVSTPADILARGQTPGWQGISIAEATVFLPPNAPIVQDLNVGVRDVVLGSPAGLQGEIRLEFGRTPVSPDLFEFLQDLGGPQTLSTGGSGRDLTVDLLTGTTQAARVRANMPAATAGTSTHPEVSWTLPDGTTVTRQDTGWFTTEPGQTLTAQPSEEVDGQRVFEQSNTFTFKAATLTVAPQIGLTLNGASIDNVVHVAGMASALQGLAFTSTAPAADASGHTWQLNTGPNAQTATGNHFTIGAALPAGTQYLVYTDSGQRTRRVRIDVLAEGQLLVGAGDGIHDATGALLTPRGVAGTYNLAGFHRDATLRAFMPQATTSAVPDGALAELTLDLGTGTEPDEPADPITEEEIRRLQVRFAFQTADPTVWGAYVPRTQEGTIEATVAAWASFFPGATFVVIGRTCDLGTASFNTTLAKKRAEKAATWLPTAATVLRGEQTAPSAAMTTAQNAVTPAMDADEKTATWLIKSDFTDAQRTAWGSTTTNATRVEYRRVDIYAVGGTYTPPAGTPGDSQQAPTDTQETDAALRRSYRPGIDVVTITPPGRKDPALPFLVRIVVKWDSPTVTSLSDAIPTQAEFTFEWASTNVTLPTATGSQSVPVRSPSDTSSSPSTEIFTLTGRWAYDARSGQTVFSLSIESHGDPNGLAALDSEVLAIALALAPALLAGIGASGVDGAAVRMGALAIASGIFATIAKDGRVVIHRAEVEHRQRSLTDATGFRTRLLLDYTCEVGFDVEADGLGAIGTDDEFPMKVTYKGVGLEFDDAKTQWYEKFGLVYEDVSFEIADPGRWAIEGPMGDILRVAATRAGAGSTWFELDLEFVLDLGVVAITGATVRIIIDGTDFSAELRGLGLSVDIEGVLSGSGRLVLGDGGAFKAALELSLPTVGVKGMGDLSYDPAEDFLSIGLGLILPVGIPLANSGLGIFGFLGRFVSNGRRALPAGFDDDPVGREIAWYRSVPGEDKFEPFRGQWALGLGVIVGTLPDQAFTFNATGMIVVCFPDPTVILGIDAKLIQKPEPAPKEQGSAGAGLEILGLVVVDDSAVMLGVRGGYEIPKVLKLTVPLDGYFPYPDTPKDAFVRIGADGVEGRGGDPVSVTLLPETLDAKAFAYLMVEEKQLHNLGGDDRFDFDGFSIGFGAGFDIRWSAGPIKLEASAKVLVGLGTNPFLLKGGIMVNGELDLVVVSVGANGEIIATIWGPVDDLKVNLNGKFCGHVDLFFFEVEGCVRFDIGDSLTPGPPPPPAPIGKVSLTDRRGFTTAEATTGTPGPDQTVWPDTVPVIEFTHRVAMALSGSAFDVPTPTPAGPTWSGTSEMKYAYRITGLELRRGSTPEAGPLVANWWHPTHRPGVLAVGDVAVSEEEGLFLALLSWNPAPWSYWLTDGGEGSPGDPAITPGRLCDPAPKPDRACALGKQASRTASDAIRIATPSTAAAPFPSSFAYTPHERVLGTTPAQALPVLGAVGLGYEPGAVGAGPFGEDLWWLSRVTRFGFTERTCELSGPIGSEIRDPELELVVCRDYRKRPQEAKGRETTCYDSGKDHPKANVTLGPTTNVGPVKLAANGDLRTMDTGSGIGIRFPDSGLRLDLPMPVDEVTVTLFLGGREVRVTALDAQGRIVDIRTSGTQQKVLLETTVTGTGITAVQLTGGTSEAMLVRVCLTRVIQGAIVVDRLDAASSEWPVVVAVGTDRRGRRVEQQWKAKPTKTVQGRNGECSLLLYAPTKPGITWSSLTIQQWSGTGKDDAGAVGLSKLCGVNAAAAVQAAQNAAAVKDLKDLINTGATSADPSTVRNLLQPNSTYEVRIRWEWQGWIKTESQPTPPATPSGPWTSGGEHVVKFRTAATLVSSGTPPAELVDERTFDPRSLIRYLIGFDPDTGNAPHLLDDSLLVHLGVDHADRLVNLYNHDLQLRLRRTDPPPGSLASGDHPANEDLTVVWGPLYDAKRPLSEQRYLDAIREAPCLDEPPLGGTTATVTADLVPGAWYDLMLMATPVSDPDAEQVVVSRAHFQASRYRSAADLLAALGFTDPASPFVAGDAIVSSPLSSTALAMGDKAFDAALSGLGMDPWPLSPEARTTVLWWRDGTAWKVAGLLLEAPEAIVRSGLTSLDVGTAKYGSVTLTVARRNDAGTRVLLVPATPSTVPSSASAIRLDLARKTTAANGTVTTSTVSGQRQALRVPRSVYQEAGA